MLIGMMSGRKPDVILPGAYSIRMEPQMVFGDSLLCLSCRDKHEKQKQWSVVGSG